MPSGGGPSHPFGLAGRVAVVTGAARGIGRVAAVALAAAGADVAGIDIVAEVRVSTVALTKALTKSRL